MSLNTTFTNPPPTINLPNMSVPPPTTNFSAPPPALTMINTSPNYQSRYPNHREINRGFFKPFRPYHAPKLISGNQDILQDEFDGKRLRKSVMRKTVDYNSSIIKTLENRIWQRDYRDRRALQPDVIYYPDLLPPPSYIDNPINAVTTRFVKTATNKMRCPIFCMAWTPEGRRLVTGASSGEFTLWNGLTFNFETILQAHDSPVRTMVWSHNESWMVTGDHAGYVKYWQSNMNNVKMFQAHKEAIRGLSFSPTDHKLATCSDDGTVRIWDFLRCHEERILRGHGADVKCVHWHPQKSLVISGSKDNQQPVKLWDTKSGHSLATLHAHKSTVMDIKWNENGNWLVTASRDHLLKLFDLRNLSQEVQTFRGHKKEASSVAWHPSHEGLFCSGGSDGAILFWHVGADKEVGAIEQAHDSIVWTLAWHPLGHILCSGSNDHTSKFWTRNRPGDLMRDKYNLNTLPAGAGGVDDQEVADEAAVIPGMGPEDRINTDSEQENKNGEIPGLDLDHNIDENKKLASKKVPYSKPIPRNFQAQWNEMEAEDLEQVEALNAIVNQLIETTPGAVPLNDVIPNAIILYGKMIPVESGSKLAEAISKGADAINKLVQSGEIDELRDIIDIDEQQDEIEDYLLDDGEIDYSKVPDIDLPAPLASSKFAQNPELLKALNRGGKRKFDQLIGWTEGGVNDKTSKNHQPAFSATYTDDTDSTLINDTELKFINNYSDRLLGKDKCKQNENDDYRRNVFEIARNNRIDEQDLKLNFSNRIDRHCESHVEFELKNNLFYDNDLRLIHNTFSETSTYIQKEDEIRTSWEDEKRNIRKSELPVSKGNFDKSNVISGNPYQENNISNLTNHHNMQNINPNMRPSNVTSYSIISQHSSKLNIHQTIEGSLSQIISHHNAPPPFRPNGPPPQMSTVYGSTNFRTQQNGNFPPNIHFRQLGLLPTQGHFNNFSGPPPTFRPINSNFDRNNFGGTNFRGQSPTQQSTGTSNNYNLNYGNYSGKNGPNRNSSIIRAANDNNRSNFNNRGRGRDNDQLRGSRGRDNY